MAPSYQRLYPTCSGITELSASKLYNSRHQNTLQSAPPAMKKFLRVMIALQHDWRVDFACMGLPVAL